MLAAPMGLAQGVLWEAFFDGGQAVSVQGERVFIIRAGNLVGLEPSTGRTLWEAAPPVWAQSPLVATETQLYSSSKTGAILAYNHDGQQLWETQVFDDSRPPVHSLVPASPYLLAITQKVIVALDAASGELRWRAEPSHGWMGRPQVTDNVIVLETIESGAITIGVIYALSLEMGETLWSRGYEQVLKVETDHLFTGQVWHIGSLNFNSATVRSRDLFTGDALWETEYTYAEERYSSPRLYADGDDVVIAQMDTVERQFSEGHTASYCCYASTIYRARLEQPESVRHVAQDLPVGTKVLGSPVGGALYLTSDDNFDLTDFGAHLIRLNLGTGEQQLYETVQTSVEWLEPHDTLLYLGLQDNRLLVVDRVTGERLFQQVFDAPVDPPVYRDEGLILLRSAQQLTAIRHP